MAVRRRDRRAVQALVDGELSAAEAAALRARAQRDPELQTYLNRMERVRETLGGLPRPEAPVPRPVVVDLRPRWGLALAGAAFVLGLGVRLWTAPAPTNEVPVAVSLSAPGATHVAVTGDFDGWSQAGRLHDADGDGVWEGVLHLAPGRYAYQFVVDGEWQSPPDAAAYRPDGFGGQNGVMEI